MDNKTISKLEENAINQAIKGQFKDAIDTNKEIIKLDKNNLNAELRLGFSYMQVSKYDEALKHYATALKIQPANQIAKNNIEKLKIITETKTTKNKNQEEVTIDPSLFLNILGKTKILALVNIGQIEILAHLKTGQEVFLKPKTRRIEIRTKANEYVGAFPDDLSRRLIFFIKAKSEYQIFIKEVSRNLVEVFIKETKKGAKVAKYISFPKDISDNMKFISESDDPEKEEGSEDEMLDKDVPIIDLEKLAEEVAEKENLEQSETTRYEEEKEEFEE